MVFLNKTTVHSVGLKTEGLQLWLLALVIGDRWKVTGHLWHKTRDRWHMRSDTQLFFFFLFFGGGLVLVLLSAQGKRFIGLP